MNFFAQLIPSDEGFHLSTHRAPTHHHKMHVWSSLGDIARSFQPQQRTFLRPKSEDRADDRSSWWNLMSCPKLRHQRRTHSIKRREVDTVSNNSKTRNGKPHPPGVVLLTCAAVIHEGYIPPVGQGSVS